MGVHTDPIPALAMCHKPKDGWDSWRCVIAGEPWPGLNLTQMAHWSKVRKHRQAITQLIWALGQKPLPQFEAPARVTLIRWYGKRQRPLDDENLFGGSKPIIDALRQHDGYDRRGRNRGGGLGIIVDDAPHQLERHVLQRRSPDATAYIEIQVEGRKA